MPQFLQVTDLGKPRLTSELTAEVRINITDVNDCAPAFSQSEYNVTLLLPTYANVAVLQVNATDEDSSENSTLRYDIIEGNRDGVFAIDATTGIITTRDVESIGPAYRLAVRVSDGKFAKVAQVHVNVETSENSGLIFQRPTYEGSIMENSTKISTVAVVNVLGSTLNEHIEFAILNPTDMFQIGLTSGAIQTTGRKFDREVRDNYELIVEARSQQPDREKPRVAHVIVNVTILDINDNCPMFVNLPYYAVVSVDDPRGSVITKVHALDLDSFENGEVRYEMKRGHGELFKVDRKTGEVTLKQTLEGHNRDYELLISAYDGGITPCSTDVTVHVKVRNGVASHSLFSFFASSFHHAGSIRVRARRVGSIGPFMRCLPGKTQPVINQEVFQEEPITVLQPRYRHSVCVCVFHQTNPSRPDLRRSDGVRPVGHPIPLFEVYCYCYRSSLFSSPSPAVKRFFQLE